MGAVAVRVRTEEAAAVAAQRALAQLLVSAITAGVRPEPPPPLPVRPRLRLVAAPR
ncbi:MAG TPA: hypothetical protein PKA64_06410 [Myxococcota bacterium]|nr:hypothetical protein [Myxococcota bacterium]